MNNNNSDDTKTNYESIISLKSDCKIRQFRIDELVKDSKNFEKELSSMHVKILRLESKIKSVETTVKMIKLILGPVLSTTGGGLVINEILKNIN